ncbi:epoxyqueuosine reductase QueH [Anaerovibrio sp.]|uniref:epoxyqueuosine reductase QueH n=1 Tax=Anaerovibrio sp. TaxID=1872532 RepID=UPI003890EF22
MNLLLHMCCGPCSCYPVKKLREDGIEPTGYFFNPNIHPYREWEMRLNAAKDFARKVDMEIIIDENYMLRDFLKKALAAESVENGRCRMCYTWRLEQAAKFAAENGFEAFTSTLFYSIYQQHELMKETAQHFADIYGVKFYYEDFRHGWQEGIDISKELELYRQPYCGCIFSEEERYSKAIRKQRKKEAKARKRAMMEAAEGDNDNI